MENKENKRFKMFICITVIVILLVGMGFYILQKLKSNDEIAMSEYTPQEEISDEQFRSTIVKLYFKEATSNNLRVENKSVDAKELINNPYLTLINLLIQGPSDSNWQSAIPQGTQVLNISLSGDVLVVDFSNEFVEKHIGGAEAESATIYSIVNTLTELTEVNSVKFLINGEEGKAFKDNAISFSEPFVRK